jgi:hypothetical protein
MRTRFATIAALLAIAVVVASPARAQIVEDKWTFQALGGWRYIDYSFKSSSNIESLTFNGPMLGVAFNW